jgi:uncharacterized protein
MIHQQIKNDLKAAMLAKESVKLSVVRGILAGFTNELVTLKRKPSEELSDDEALGVIRRLSKQRKDSIEQFRGAGREDLASKEEEELAILGTYLPAMMSKDEIKKVAEAKKTELGIDDKSKMGMFMGAVMKELKGNADGSDVKEVVESLF